MASDINISADFSDLIDQTSKALKLTNDQIDALKRYIQVTVQYNDAGQKVGATISAQISDTQKLTAAIVDEGNGYEFLKGKLTQISQARVDATKAAKDQVTAYNEAAKAAKAAADAEAQYEKKLNDIAAKKATMAANQARVTVLDSVVRGQTEAERSRLQGSGVDISTATQGKLAVMARQIGEVGVKAGLTTKGLQDLFSQVNAGNFSQIESKYAQVVASILRYNAQIDSERERLAKGVSNQGAGAGKGPGKFPDEAAPSSTHLQAATQYFNILGRISGTLTNLALYRGFNFITKSLTDSVSAAREFETQVALIRTLSQDASLSANQWTVGLKALSSELGADFKDVSGAAYDAVSSQLTKGADTFAYVKEVGQLAKVAGTDIKTAGEAVQSVLNSYNLSADKAGEVSAKLFKTIDNGNVKLADFAGSFGRIGTLGQELGVSENELLAFISTFTRAGVKTTDAITLLNNVMTKLLQPTEATKKVFDELGIASGPAAVKLTNLQTVLSKLLDAESQGKTKSIDLFPEIRGEKGLTLYKQNLAGVSKDLDDIAHKSQDQLTKAKDIVFSTDAQKITETVQTFKNALATSVGQSFNKLVADQLTVRGGDETPEVFMKRMEESASRLFRTLAAGAAGITAFIAGLRTIGIVSELLAIARLKNAAASAADTAATIRNTAATTANAAAQARLNAAKAGGGLGAVAGANPLLAVGALAAAGIATYAAYKVAAVDTFDSAGEAITDMYRRLKDPDANKKLEESIGLTKQLKDEFENAAKTFGKSLQEALAKNNVALGDIREKLRVSQDALKEGFAGAISIAESKLKDVKTRIDQINSSLSSSAAKNLEFQEKGKESVYGMNNRYANPQQQLQLIETEYVRLDKKIQGLVKEGTPAAIEEAKKLTEEKLKLTTSYFEKEAVLQQKAFEDYAREMNLVGTQTFVYNDGRQVAAVNKLVAERNALDMQSKKILEEKLKLENEDKAKKEKDLQKTRDAIKAYENFSVTDAQGNVDKDFRTSTGQLDPEKAKAGLKKVIDDLKAQVPDNDVSQRIGLKQETDRRTALLNEQLARTLAGKKIADAQNGLGDAIDQQNKKLGEAEKALADYEKSVVSLATELGNLRRGFAETAKGATEGAVGAYTGKGTRGVVKGAAVDVADFLQKNTPDFVNNDPTKKQAAAARFAALDKEAAAIDDLQKEALGKKITDPKTGKQATDIRGIEEAYNRTIALKEKLKAAAAATLDDYGVDRSKADDFLKVAGKPIDDTDKLAASLKTKLDEAKTNAGLALQGLDAAQQKVKDLTATMKAATDAYSAMNNGIAAIGGNAAAQLNNTILQLQRVAELADKVVAATKNGSNPIQPSTVAPPGQVPMDNGQNWNIVPNPQPRFMGGPIYKAYGGPIGQDNVPLWAAHGEFMMNKQATNRFYSQIASMNSTARVPQYFNSGGPVTNMGGVTMHVHETKNPQVTAREIQRLLDRSSRMGNTK